MQKNILKTIINNKARFTPHLFTEKQVNLMEKYLQSQKKADNKGVNQKTANNQKEGTNQETPKNQKEEKRRRKSDLKSVLKR